MGQYVELIVKARKFEKDKYKYVKIEFTDSKTYRNQGSKVERRNTNMKICIILIF